MMYVVRPERPCAARDCLERLRSAPAARRTVTVEFSFFVANFSFFVAHLSFFVVFTFTPLFL